MSARVHRSGQRLAALVLATIAVTVLATPSARAATTRPALGRTVEAIPVQGRVYLTVAGTGAMRLRAARIVPVGSIIDARHGTVRIISATNGSGGRESAEFQLGRFQVLQPTGDGGGLEVALVGGNFASCVLGSAARHHGGVVRQLRTISGYGQLRAIGRYGSAGPGRHGIRRAILAGSGRVEWDTVDRCSGTAIVDHLGAVSTVGESVPARFTLSPQETIAYYCGAVPGASKAYCAVLRGVVTTQTSSTGPVRTPQFLLTLVTESRSAQAYALTISAPDNTATDTAYPLTAPSSRGFQRSDVACFPDEGRGAYQVTWRLRRRILASIDYQAPANVAADQQCTSVPFGRGYPAELTQTVVSAQGHFVVHYTADPNSADVSTKLAAETVAATAERALAYDTTVLGMPSYLNDGDGKLDIYLDHQSPSGASAFLAAPAGRTTLPPPGYPSAAFIAVPPNEYASQFTIAYAVFGALRDAIGRILGFEPPAFVQSTDVWAASNFTQRSEYTPTLSQPLDCDATCPPDATFAQWRFYQHLAEQFGFTIVANIFTLDAAAVRQQPTSHMVASLEAVLEAHGTTLAAELGQYALEDLSIGWPAGWVAGSARASGGDYVKLQVTASGQAFSDLPPLTVAHLASQYVWVTVPVQRPCIAETLTLTVTVPAGGLVPGAVVDTQGQTQIVAPGTPAPNTAQFQIPLASCAAAAVRLPVVNTTPTTDGLQFPITGSLVRVQG